MTRNGKIARLTDETRTALNQRLLDGGEGESLLAWLNALPEVQKTVKKDFDGIPVSKQNLSEWRQGGFREWQLRRDLLEQARTLTESAEELDLHVGNCDLVDNLAIVVAARYAALLAAWDGEVTPEFEKKLKVLRGLGQDVTRLQRSMHQAALQNIEQSRLQDEEEEKESDAKRKEALKPITMARNWRNLADLMGGGPGNEETAAYITAVNNDVDVHEFVARVCQKPAESNPVKPKTVAASRKSAANRVIAENECGGLPARRCDRQTLSNPIKPNGTDSAAAGEEAAASGTRNPQPASQE